jgi:uncharacterized protein YciI
MKRRHGVKTTLLGLALAFALSSAAFAQVAPASAAAAMPAKNLFAVEIRTGPQWNAALPPGQQPLMREHSANLRKLRDEGRIRIGARYGEVGLVVLEAATIDEARAWIEADPAMRAGTFRFEIHPFGVFYGGTVGR